MHRRAPKPGDDWILDGAMRDQPVITPEWLPRDRSLIEGVCVREMKNVYTGCGALTEVFRSDWKLDPQGVDQVFQRVLEGHALSAWHAHEHTTDRIFVNQGCVRIVLYDSRPRSSTRGLLNVFVHGVLRPAVVSIPPRVWHGVQNVEATPSSVINVVDRAYAYEAPDHVRLPPDTNQIPYSFGCAPKNVGD